MGSQLDELVMTTEARIEAWRAEARIIADQAKAAEADGHVNSEHLVFIEQLLGAIYQEMDAFDLSSRLLPDVDDDASMRLARLSDAIRLVLLEITELGNTMYGIVPVDGDPLPEWILRAESLRLTIPPISAA